MTLRGLVASLDGKTLYKKELKGDKVNAVALGNEMGNALLDMGGDKIMQEIYST